LARQLACAMEQLRLSDVDSFFDLRIISGIGAILFPGGTVWTKRPI